MKAEIPYRMIHFHHLDQKELNELLKVSNHLSLNCCYLGHQEVKKEDFILISSSIKTAELKRIREAYSNWIFCILSKSLKAEDINYLNEIGKIYYLNDISKSELSARINLIDGISQSEIHIKERTSENEHTLAVISHDLKNPLNAIRLDAQILLRNSKKKYHDFPAIVDDVKRYASRIIKTTDRLALLVSDLLDNDKSDNVLVSLTRTPVEVEKLVDEVIDIVSPIAKRNSLKIKKRVEGVIPLVLADKNKLFQVLLNLLSNALKFSQQHTSVQIGVRFLDNKICFFVEDAGPGIDPDLESNIYERYNSGSRRECGSGLGLYICRTIVEAHQGKINHRKGTKGGTIFEFFIPLEMERNENNKNKVYLIDDDEDLRDVLSWALNSEGFNVESFANPASALEYLEESTEKPTLILSEFNTSGMSILEFLQKRKKLELDEVPLIFLSTSPEDINKHVDVTNYTHILRKPLDLDAFVLTVSQFMKITCTQ